MPLLEPEFLSRLEQLRLVSRSRASGRLPGVRPSRRTGSSIELADHREYQPGDDLRYVDWQAYARLGRLFVKLWMAEEDLVVTIIVDASASMACGQPTKLERAKQLAAACGFIALTGGDQLRLAVLAGRAQGKIFLSPLLRGRAEALWLFRKLEELLAGGRADLDQDLSFVAASLPHPGGLSILLTDGLDPAGPGALAKGLRALYGAHQEIVFLQLLSPSELRPNNQGEYRFLDAEGGPAVELALTRSVLQLYQVELQQWLQEIQTSSRQLGVDHLLVDTQLPWQQAVWQGLHSLRRLQLRPD